MKVLIFWQQSVIIKKYVNITAMKIKKSFEFSFTCCISNSVQYLVKQEQYWRKQK